VQQFRYREVEAALVAALQISQENLGAFRGRLQHLRAQGVPDLPRTGKGTMTQYGREHVLQMLVALELERIGIAPRAAAMGACSIVRVVANRPPVSREHVFIALDSPTTPRYTVLTGRRVFHQWLKAPPRAFGVIDLTSCIQVLDGVLAKQADEPAQKGVPDKAPPSRGRLRSRPAARRQMRGRTG
jgi:hypothetical protein